HVFYGIPYAASPLGDYRFRSPRSVTTWSGVRDASKPGPACIQDEKDYPAMHFMGAPPYNKWKLSEDCLTLDVYTRSTTGKRPVIVYIHGGALQAGQMNEYDFRAYSSVRDIVVVPIQYRLGALGWASMEDEHMPANLGFQDQVMALKWVQQNIHHFGGDPNQVTIIGQSAGGWSITMHIISPMSKGLFKRAIAQSGSIIRASSFSPNVLVSSMGTCMSLFMQEFSGCPSNDSRAMAECFRKLPVERFAASESEPCKQKLLATADGVYLPDDPEKLLRTGQYNKDIDVIMGTMSTEGYWLSATRIPPLVAEDTSLERVQGYFLHEITRRYPRLPLYVRQAAVAAAVVAYVRDTRTNGLIKAATEFFGDSFLLWPTYATALDFSKTLEGKTYFYQIRHRPSISNHPDFIGSDHCDDLVLMLGTQFTNGFGVIPLTISDEDRIVADAIFNAWSNFAIHGNPNSEGLAQWPQFDSVHQQFMVFDVESHAEMNFQSTRMNFWTHTLPQLAKSKVADIIRGIFQIDNILLLDYNTYTYKTKYDLSQGL
ncbi:hypothetical protein CAPTEDRAFT_111930, partial [Capitella teleta]|uniref:Carboxylic ester hydrolase n=1 Tax=Capitella teleta TaxID=283909 RepID=X1YV75_CAPTE